MNFPYTIAPSSSNKTHYWEASSTLTQGGAGFMTFSFDGMVSLNWDFDKYRGAFHRLRMNCHLALEQVDPFLHAENADPLCGGRFNLLRLYIKTPAIVLDLTFRTPPEGLRGLFFLP
jgi:hypothetical protein